ncbi:Piwi domain-containing protein [Endogone sp. FLAS-F59071]|nr:Piwi domain-containing protein [Endogone sp. FLAS-F59071]|eukprot:RUS13746.1 Piwi domain-containing protein [Endogone sp. FLAS-F59071]
MTSNPNANLDQIIDQAVAKTPNCKMFMFILPFDSGTLYPNLKRISDCRLGIPTQCVVHKKLFKANDQYYTNVALKVNHKLGGTNNKLKEKLPLFDKPTMVLGAASVLGDVTHPGGGSNAPSIASVVGSITPDANLYVARVEFQESRIEYIEKFQSMFFHCLRLFKTKSGVLPERILYYRDGVGEGMFKEIKRLEIEAMLKAFDQVPKPYSPNIKTPNYRPTISMIVVQKRHHARFFPINPQDQDRSSNCPAGMVVETGITHPVHLQSQAGLQGTSRPTHYHVLHDENKFTPDALQELTNKMCYLQGRCTRSVRIVPAVYHADLVCFRARCHLNNLDAWSHSSQGKSDVKPEDLASKISQKLERGYVMIVLGDVESLT